MRPYHRVLLAPIALAVFFLASTTEAFETPSSFLRKKPNDQDDNGLMKNRIRSLKQVDPHELLSMSTTTSSRALSVCEAESPCTTGSLLEGTGGSLASLKEAIAAASSEVEWDVKEDAEKATDLFLETLKGAQNDFTDLQGAIEDALAETSVEIQGIVADIVNLILGIIQSIVSLILGIISSVVGIIIGVIEAAIGLILGIVGAIVGLIQQILAAILAVISAIIGIFVPGVAADGLFVPLEDYLDSDAEAPFESLKGWLPGDDDSGMMNVIDKAKASMGAIKQSLAELLTKAKQALVNPETGGLVQANQGIIAIISNIIALIFDIINSIISLFFSIISSVLSLIVGIISSIIGLVLSIISAILDIIFGIIQAILAFIQGIIDAILPGRRLVGGTILDHEGSLWQKWQANLAGLKKFLQQVASTLNEGVQSAVDILTDLELTGELRCRLGVMSCEASVLQDVTASMEEEGP